MPQSTSWCGGDEHFLRPKAGQTAVRTASMTMLTRPTAAQLRLQLKQMFKVEVDDMTCVETLDVMGGLTITAQVGPNKLIIYVPSDALAADSKIVPTFHNEQHTFMHWGVPAYEMEKKTADTQKVFTDVPDSVLPDPAIVPKRRFSFEDGPPATDQPSQGKT